MATNAKYKRYDGTNWVEYHFTTNAGQVSTTYNSETGAGRKFVTPNITINSNTAGTNGAKVTVGSGDAANIEIDGAHITGKAVAVTNSSLEYISDSDSVAVALGKLDKAIVDAASSVPSDVVTFDSNGDVDIDDGDLYYVGSVSFSGGGSIAFDNSNNMTIQTTNGAIFIYPDTKLYYGASAGTDDANEIVKKSDLTSYVPTSRTVNSKALSSNITLYGTDIAMASNDATTVTAAISAVQAQANGLTTAYAVDTTTTGTNIYNSSFDSTDSDLAIAVGQATSTTSNGKITVLNASGSGTTDVKLDDLKVGDSVFIKKTSVPDRWYAGKTAGAQGTSKIIYHFYTLESYNMAWSAITGTPTTLAGYGITDAKIDNGTITLGSNTITPLTSHQSLDGYLPLAAGSTKKLTGTLYVGSQSVGDLGLANPSIFADYLSLRSTNALELSSLNNSLTLHGGSNDYHTFGVKIKVPQLESGESASVLECNWQIPRMSGLMVSTNTFASREWVNSQNFAKVTVGNTQPSNPSAGAIWFDTSTN